MSARNIQFPDFRKPRQLPNAYTIALLMTPYQAHIYMILLAGCDEGRFDFNKLAKFMKCHVADVIEALCQMEKMGWVRCDSEFWSVA